MSAAAPTPTLPARAPDGYRFRFSNYRNYVLFAATSLFMAVACIILLVGVNALANGEEAWNAYRAGLGSPVMLLLSSVVLIFTLYFALRFGWVGRKIPFGLSEEEIEEIEERYWRGDTLGADEDDK